MTPLPTDRPTCSCGRPLCVIRSSKAGSSRIRELGCRRCKFWKGGKVTSPLPVATKSLDSTSLYFTSIHNGDKESKPC